MAEKTIKQRLGFIGAGNMANAICEGLVRKGKFLLEIILFIITYLKSVLDLGRVTYSQIYVSGPRLQHLESWKKKGAHITTKNGDILDEADVIFLSIKPHILPEAAANMFETCQPSKATNKLFISILAGVTLESLENVSIFIRITL